MKYKDPTTGEFKELKIRATDELPIGSEIDVDDNTDIPAGWEQTEELNTYSTTEQRIGTWIDGKPLYRRVYSQSNKDSINLSSLNYDYIEIVSTRMNNSGYVRYPYYTSSTDYFRVLINSSKVMGIETSASSIINWTTTIQYTKTTD